MRSDLLYLVDIVEAATTVERFFDAMVEAKPANDDLYLSAILQKLLVIGEAAARISPTIKTQFDTVEWQDIIGFRNYAIHAYFALDWDVVRHAALVDTPRLKTQVEKILVALADETGQGTE